MPTATAASTLYTLYRPRSGVMIYDSKTYALSARSLRSRPVGCLNRQEGSLRVLEQGMPTYTLDSATAQHGWHIGSPNVSGFQHEGSCLLLHVQQIHQMRAASRSAVAIDPPSRWLTANALCFTRPAARTCSLPSGVRMRISVSQTEYLTRSA